MCTTSSQIKCASGLELESSKCEAPCTGLIVSSFFKSEKTIDIESLIPNEVTVYYNLTKWSKLHSKMKGW